MSVKINLSENDRKVAYAAQGDDKTRSYLSFVHICDGKIQAIDGFMLATRAIACKETTSIPAKVLKQYKGDLTVHRDGQHVIVERPERTDIYTKDEAKDIPGLSEKIKVLVDGAKKNEAKAAVAIDANLLKKVLAILPSGKECSPVKIYVGSHTDPVRFERDGTTVIVMPCFVQW